MQKYALRVLFILGVMVAMLLFAGCDDNNDNNRSTIRGTVANAGTGFLEPGLQIALFRTNGTRIGSVQTTGNGGQFSFGNLSSGTYYFRVRRAGEGTFTYSGVLEVPNETTLDISVPFLGQQQLADEGYTVPGDGTAAALSFAVLDVEDPELPGVTNTLQVDGFVSDPDAPASIQNIPVPGPHDVDVFEGGRQYSYGPVTFEANTIAAFITNIELLASE